MPLEIGLLPMILHFANGYQYYHLSSPDQEPPSLLMILSSLLSVRESALAYGGPDTCLVEKLSTIY